MIGVIGTEAVDGVPGNSTQTLDLSAPAITPPSQHILSQPIYNLDNIGPTTPSPLLNTVTTDAILLLLNTATSTPSSVFAESFTTVDFTDLVNSPNQQQNFNVLPTLSQMTSTTHSISFESHNDLFSSTINHPQATPTTSRMVKSKAKKRKLN